MNKAEITDRHNLIISCGSSTIEWTLTEFDSGERLMLAAHGANIHFTAHFTAEQWSEFRALVAGGQS